MLYIGIDLGTSASKFLLVDEVPRSMPIYSMVSPP